MFFLRDFDSFLGFLWLHAHVFYGISLYNITPAQSHGIDIRMKKEEHKMSKKLTPKSLNLHTNAHADRDRPILKDGDECEFRKGLFRDLRKSSSNDSKVKPVHTSSHSIVDDQCSKKITNDNTIDTDKKNNSTKIKYSEDEESVDVNGIVTHEQSNVAILESIKLTYNNPQYYKTSSFKVSKFIVFVRLLIIMLYICYVVLCNNKAILFYIVFILMIAVTSLIVYVIYSSFISINSLLASLLTFNACISIARHE